MSANNLIRCGYCKKPYLNPCDATRYQFCQNFDWLTSPDNPVNQRRKAAPVARGKAARQKPAKAPAKPTKPASAPLKALRHHVTGAVKRGEKKAIAGKPAKASKR